MADYSEYYIKDLLEAIKEGCQKIGEKRDFEKYLLSMEQAESVERLIEIYDNIYKLLFVFTYGNTFPHDWYIPENGGYYKPHLVELLNRYFNDNIERLSKKYKYIPDVELTFYIANLRECINAGIVQSKMMERSIKADKFPFKTLGNACKTQYDARKGIETMYRLSSKYGSAINIYKKFSALLAIKGRIFDVSEIAFAKDHDIDYEASIVQYKEDEERRKKEIAEQKLAKERQISEIKEKEKKKALINILIAIPVIILLFYILSFICKALDILIIPAIFYLIGLFLLAI